MIKSLAIRLLSVSLFSGLVLAACSGSSGNGAPSDAGVDAWGDNSRDAGRNGATDATAGDATGNDDGGLDGGAGEACPVPSTTRCSGNGVQVCSDSSHWGASMDCGQAACVD